MACDDTVLSEQHFRQLETFAPNKKEVRGSVETQETVGSVETQETVGSVETQTLTHKTSAVFHCPVSRFCSLL